MTTGAVCAVAMAEQPARSSRLCGRHRRALGKHIMEGRIAEQRRIISQLSAEVQVWRWWSRGLVPPQLHGVASQAYAQVVHHARACVAAGAPFRSASGASQAAGDGHLGWHRRVNRRRHAVGRLALAAEEKHEDCERQDQRHEKKQEKKKGDEPKIEKVFGHSSSV